MSIEELTAEAMALPPNQRASLAEALWQSIDVEDDDVATAEIIAEACRRSDELSSGAVVGLTHEEVMEAVRRAIAQ